MSRQLWLEEGIDLRRRIVQLTGDVGEEMLTKVLRTLHLFRGQSVKYILTSEGGDVGPGLAICDLFRIHKGRITVEVLGHAESMAGVILQAADVRILHSNSYVMLHQGELSNLKGHKKNIKSFIKLSDEEDDRCDAIVLRRIQEKKRGYSWAKFREETNFDLYFSADQALKWGLADKVVR